jgi:sugar phosphate isomerase/epimerase
MDLQIGCMNRPWNDFSIDQAFAGIAAAGFDSVQFCVHQGKNIFDADSTDAEIEKVRQKLQSYRLKFTMISAGPDFSGAVADAVDWYVRLLANIEKLGGAWLMSCGVMDEAQYENWYAVTREICPLAAEHGIKVCLKPHGGIGATADDLLRCIDRVDHPNFSINYDAGNVHYYTGHDAAKDILKIAEHVSSTCIKDQRGGIRGEVMFTPGEGVVDFEAVYGALRDVGYQGPNWIECVGGKTCDEINAEAKKTKAFMESVWAQL